MLKYINIPVFVISFAFGIFAVYVTAPDKQQIVVYPSPDNIDHIQYKDYADNCFQFRQSRVTCPTNADQISRIPIQTK